MGWSPDSNMISTYIHLAKTDVKEYQRLQLVGEDEKPLMVEIIKPKESATDKFNKQERDLIELREMVQGLMKAKLKREPILDSIAQLHTEYFPRKIYDPHQSNRPLSILSFKPGLYWGIFSPLQAHTTYYSEI